MRKQRMIHRTAAASIVCAVLPLIAVSGAVAQTPARPPLNEPLDYGKLYNPVYDYDDIVRAKTAFMSDDDVARVLKMVKRSGLPFRYFVAAYARKEPFTKLAKRAGVGMAELKNVSEEKDELAAYEAAYLATGEGARRRNRIDVLLAKAAMAKPNPK